MVWQPISGGTREAVPEAAKRVNAPRARHFWDGPGTTLSAFKRLLGTPREAWDLYLVYGRGAEWGDGANPPKPDYLMHQLRGAGSDAWDGAELLEPNAFRKKVVSFLRR